MSQLQLILGGARSGKSSLGEQYAKALALPVTYIATGQALDDEMSERITQHQLDRPSNWCLVETVTKLADAIDSVSTSNHCIIIDCLTLWLSNCLCQHNLGYFQQEKQHLLKVLHKCQQTENLHIILISNEVGHGIVPMGDLSRQFVDQAGWLHQAIAKVADHVEFVIAGLPITLKPSLNMSLQGKQ